MSFLAPLAFGLAALAIPLVVLYMLRSRRRRVDVSSTFLWEQVGEPVSSAVPWQRLRVTPLLLLQLATLAAFVTVLARPFFTQATLLGPHTVFVIDTSGSMGMAGRLDRAKERALALAADVSEAKLVSVVEAGPAARVLTAFAQDPVRVAEAIGSLQPTGGVEDLTAAIRLARGLATPDRPSNILLFTDGGSVELPDEPVVGATHIRFDHLGDNLAITAFSTEPSTEGTMRAFLEVANFSGEARDVRVELSVDGLAAGFVDLEVGPSDTARQTIPIDAGPGAVLAARLLGEGDALLLDDRAEVVVGSGPERRVAVVGQGSPFLSALVDIAPGFTDAGDAPPDLLIVDGGELPEIDRPAWLLRTDTPPPGITVNEFVQNAAVTYQRPAEPILDDVDLSAMAVAEAQVVEAPGWLPLVRAGEVPLVLLGEVNGYRVVYFTFDLIHSNLPVQVAFPIMGARILDWLAGGGAVAVSVESAGAPIPLAPPVGATSRITGPGGAIWNVTGQAAAFTDTGTPGVYSVEYVFEDGRVEAGPVAVRRFVATESSGSYRDVATVAAAGQVTDRSVLIREWAPWVLAAILILMAIEWWVGHQRPVFRGRTA